MKILIPAYQPDKKLIKLIKDLKNQTDMSIIVVDDGSGEKYKNSREIKEYEKRIRRIQRKLSALRPGYS